MHQPDPFCAQIRDILSTLVEVLRTPSSDVQRAVSDCLEPLMGLLASDEAFIENLINRVQGMLLKGASYGDRLAKPPRASHNWHNIGGFDKGRLQALRGSMCANSCSHI